MILLNDNVLLLIDMIIEKSPGGIVLPEAVAKTPNTGTVVAVGKKVRELKPSNRVIFEKKDITPWSDKLIFIPERCIYAKIT